MIVSCNNVALSNFLYLIFTPPPLQKKNQQKKNQERTTLSQLMIVILAIAFQTDIHLIETF